MKGGVNMLNPSLFGPIYPRIDFTRIANLFC